MIWNLKNKKFKDDSDYQQLQQLFKNVTLFAFLETDASKCNEITEMHSVFCSSQWSPVLPLRQRKDD